MHKLSGCSIVAKRLMLRIRKSPSVKLKPAMNLLGGLKQATLSQPQLPICHMGIIMRDKEINYCASQKPGWDRRSM